MAPPSRRAPADLASHLAMDHLREEQEGDEDERDERRGPSGPSRIDALKAEIASAGKSPARKAREAREKVPNELAFHFDLTTQAGNQFEGDFVNRIPKGHEVFQIEALHSRLMGYTPVNARAPEIDGWAAKVAHMSYSLTTKPVWAADLSELEEPEVVFALWAKVLEHEHRYFRRAPAQATGGGPGERQGEDDRSDG